MLHDEILSFILNAFSYLFDIPKLSWHDHKNIWIPYMYNITTCHTHIYEPYICILVYVLPISMISTSLLLAVSLVHLHPQDNSYKLSHIYTLASPNKDFISSHITSMCTKRSVQYHNVLICTICLTQRSLLKSFLQR